MAKQLSRRRRLYLRRELREIYGAVEAARILAEAVATDQLGPELDHRRAPRALTSMLSLVGERLQVLRRAAGRRDDPWRRGHRVAPQRGTLTDERLLALCAMRQRARVMHIEV